ncbi:MAG: hypothetical protein E6J87_21360 [Deltaproteobacteria bacterium]|nr:MAG: hypothetical protein E6J87_21360 [Deltaproteobacteria bacterium]
MLVACGLLVASARRRRRHGEAIGSLVQIHRGKGAGATRRACP